MKIQRLLTIAAAGLLVLSGAVLVSCQQAAAAAEAANYAGTATKTFPAHGGGYVGEAIVTTDANGNVSAAEMNEWQGPSGWVAYTGANTALVGGEVIRFAMSGANSTATNLEIKNFTFFYYNVTSKGWVEFTPPSVAGVWTVPTAAATPNFDAKMANPLYATAYIAAAKADNATDMVTVTIADGTAVAAPVVTVGAKASVSVHYGHLNKNNTAATYMPITASSIGYKANAAALLTFFKANPTANYSGAVTKTLALTAPTSVYTAATDSVWTVADVTTGATYSDFRDYALELQNAYLFALSDAKGGNVRSIE